MRVTMKPPLQVKQGVTAGVIVAAETITVISVTKGFSLWETVGVATGCFVIISALYLLMSSVNRRRCEKDGGS